MLRTSLFSKLLLTVLLSQGLACTGSQTSATQDTASPASSALSLHDIAILFPFVERPELFEKTPSLAAAAAGQEGFLPANFLPTLTKRLEKVNFGITLEMERFHINSLRVDPCAVSPIHGASKGCVPQLRLVWAPVRAMGDSVNVMDSNIHTVYDLEPSAMDAVIAELKALHKAAALDYSQEPLGPHPVIAKEGDGPFFQGVLKLVQAHAHADKLSFIAVQTSNFDAVNWFFTAYEVKNGVMQDSALQNVKQTGQAKKVQTVKLNMNGEFEDVSPRPAIARDIFFGKEASILAQTFGMSNPLLQTVATTDCASCHFADNQRLLASTRLEEQGAQPLLSSKEQYTSTWNLEQNPQFAKRTDTFQMFCIVGGFYAVSQRVINDTAESMKWLEQKGLLK